MSKKFAWKTNQLQYFNNSNICPNLYKIAYKEFLGFQSNSCYYCTASKTEVDNGYAYNVCQKAKNSTCSAWDGKIYSCGDYA